MLSIVHAETPEQIAAARKIIEEYAAFLEYNLCFQNFQAEMDGLPGEYATPSGRLLLAYWNGQAAGVIALRALKSDVRACEMKRLCVREAFRGKAIGRALVTKLIEEARQIGYSRMVLDTVQGKMDHAIALYRDFGFREIAPYYHNPIDGALYLELQLGNSASNAHL